MAVEAEGTHKDLCVQCNDDIFVIQTIVVSLFAQEFDLFVLSGIAE